MGKRRKPRLESRSLHAAFLLSHKIVGATPDEHIKLNLCIVVYSRGISADLHLRASMERTVVDAVRAEKDFNSPSTPENEFLYDFSNCFYFINMLHSPEAFVSSLSQDGELCSLPFTINYEFNLISFAFVIAVVVCWCFPIPTRISCPSRNFCAGKSFDFSTAVFSATKGYVCVSVCATYGFCLS